MDDTQGLIFTIILIWVAGVAMYFICLASVQLHRKESAEYKAAKKQAWADMVAQFDKDIGSGG